MKTHGLLIEDRLRDIPKIPTIVRDIQEMINEHEDIDNVQPLGCAHGVGARIEAPTGPMALRGRVFGPET